MPWWWPFSPSDPRADAIRSGTAIPTRDERQRCWASRDAFFACLDTHNIINTTTPAGATAARKACPADNAAFERDCSASWVTYFRQWRVADAKKKKALEELREQGAEQLPVTTSFSPKPTTTKQDIHALLEEKRRSS
ncbi:hypothetical protein CDD81_2845 [Ophiocordyceps australis]|uniref:Cytochrome c oxidase subunit 6B-like protein new16 n=1 Tax=Ophiocordyceps australis TaxID=1399860 RepID=A0A2C5XWU1_9HYPO|nr:hypothetical protein CDD81_2845 [Ophiocordyceps australis]